MAQYQAATPYILPYSTSSASILQLIVLALSRWAHVYDNRGGLYDCPGRDILGYILSHTGGAAPNVGVTQWGRSEYYLRWQHGVSPICYHIYEPSSLPKANLAQEALLVIQTDAFLLTSGTPGVHVCFRGLEVGQVESLANPQDIPSNSRVKIQHTEAASAGRIASGRVPYVPGT